jgi:phage terminase large subunit-like protein
MNLYRNLAANNMVKFTNGNVVDYNYIINDMLDMYRIARIVNVFYDPYNAPMFVQLLKSARIPTEPFSQTIGSFNRPTKHLQREILSNNVRFVKNDLIVSNFNDVIIKKDLNENEKPFKSDEYNTKIDGVIASIEALAAWMLDDKKKL